MSYSSQHNKTTITMADEQNTTYHIENAASGRAKCKKCKEPIVKGELRIATSEWKAVFAGFPSQLRPAAS